MPYLYIFAEFFLSRTLFYVLVITLLLTSWRVISYKYPRVNISFIVLLFFYRLPFIYIYYKYIPGDWIAYIDTILSNTPIELQMGRGVSGVHWIGRFLTVFHLNSLELFFAFSLFGYYAILLFYLLIHELTSYTDYVNINKLVIFPWVLLYPSLHMYTVMVGKDPIVIFAIALATFSVKNKSIHLLPLLIGLFLMVIVRAHIAVVFITALATSILFSNKWSSFKKGVTIALLLPLFITFLPVAARLFRINSLNYQAIQMAIKLNEGYVSNAGTYIDMSSYPLPAKMFTYLFRPLFIDSPNMLLLGYSLENFFFIILLLLNINISFFKWLKTQSFIIFFSFCYFVIGTLVLSNGLSVFGLFIRQKSMVFLHFLLVLFIFIYDKNKTQLKNE